MKAAGPALAFVALCACSGREAGQREAGAADQAGQSAAWMVRASASGQLKPACGGTRASSHAGMLVLLNTRQALSCRDAGFMLRRLQRPPQGEDAVRLIVPAPDTAAVCGFLAEERVRLPVFTAEPEGSHPLVTPILTLAVLRPDGGRYAVHHGVRGADLLARLRGDPAEAGTLATPVPGASR